MEKIKLSGFKSFVDPTTLSFSSDLVGIVGPNGCGKSNVIDAVRWVLGESSAKHLRGDQMADVIFNGSSTRKPVGQAFVELVFDNSDATITGEFASYRQISLKRQVNREGQSVYFLNGSRCRRKDITDLFLGTGLGPRSYAIIEQGTISRLVEAKPDELRVFLEEAAGISKYKERRRDTENRMRRTQENLERIADICEEIEKQCRHLKRQANTAERYKLLKAEERQLKAQLLALRWQALNEQDENKQKGIQALELKVEEALAGQRELEKNIEQKRDYYNSQHATLSQVQSVFYSLGSDIAKVEQALQHHQNQKQQQQGDLERLKATLATSEVELADGEQKVAALKVAIAQSDEALLAAKKNEATTNQSLTAVEQAMTDWQKNWDEFTLKVSEPKRKIDVEKSKINQLEKQLMQLAQREMTISSERSKWQQISVETGADELQEQHVTLDGQLQKDQQSLQVLQQKTLALQKAIHDESELLAALRSEYSRVAGRLESVIVLQQSNLGDSYEKVGQWLDEMGLKTASRLIEKIDVVPGWERAVETVLGSRLQAVCVDDIGALMSLDMVCPAGDVTLFDTSKNMSQAVKKTALSSLIKAEVPAMSLLNNVHYADDIEQAKRLLDTLDEHESVITKEGVWLHVDSVSFKHHGAQENTLVLEKEKKSLTKKSQTSADAISKKEQVLEKARLELSAVEKEVRELRQQESRAVHQLSNLAVQINEKKSRLEQATHRLVQIDDDIKQINDSEGQDKAALTDSKNSLESAINQSAELEKQRETLQQQRMDKKAGLDEARRDIHGSRELVHQLNLKIETQRSSLALTTQHLTIVNDRVTHSSGKMSELENQLTRVDEPLLEQKKDLDALLEKRLSIETKLVDVRTQTELTEQAIRELDVSRHQAEQLVQASRENTSSAKIAYQEVTVRKQTLVEQLQESGVDLAETLSNIPENADDRQWQEQVSSLSQKIDRLGPINLTAIEEYEAQSERKQYLDSQQLDLSEALKTLKAAIDKIDKESRILFKQTFDKVNEGFEKRFPKLFGGGHAYLQQTGEDLLETGVTVMARPPGKRNSSIHLLSGGEKALTAVALVFAIFDLNPSPFCMLDEVDAPLDEANVGRFGELVKEMAGNVQMILITHNKATMEVVNQLAGVTMKEPGVSRLVAVDLEEATKMVVS